MPVSKESKVSEWIGAIREWIPSVGVRAKELSEAVRAEPALILQLPGLRYATYAIAGLFLVLIFKWGVGLFSPAEAPPPRAETTYFHVHCANSECGNDYVIEREFDFDDFPVRCSKCLKETGHHALQCRSATCRGAWVIPQEDGSRLICPQCGAVLGAKD